MGLLSNKKIHIAVNKDAIQLSLCEERREECGQPYESRLESPTTQDLEEIFPFRQSKTLFIRD